LTCAPRRGDGHGPRARAPARRPHAAGLAGLAGLRVSLSVPLRPTLLKETRPEARGSREVDGTEERAVAGHARCPPRPSARKLPLRIKVHSSEAHGPLAHRDTGVVFFVAGEIARSPLDACALCMFTSAVAAPHARLCELTRGRAHRPQRPRSRRHTAARRQ